MTGRLKAPLSPGSGDMAAISGIRVFAAPEYPMTDPLEFRTFETGP